jgi:hypothetical protein
MMIDRAHACIDFKAEFSHGICPACIKRLYPEFHFPYTMGAERLVHVLDEPRADKILDAAVF